MVNFYYFQITRQNVIKSSCWPKAMLLEFLINWSTSRQQTDTIINQHTYINLFGRDQSITYLN